MSNTDRARIKTLIADDEQNGRLHLAKLLSEHADIEIAGKAENGRQTLALLEKGGFDLAFLDIDMPALTGVEVIRESQKREIRLPYIVFVTAYSNHGATAFELGAIDYIVKPVSGSRLEEALRKFRIYRTSGERDAGCDDALLKRFGLTSRESEICLLVKAGHSREEIQERLSFSAGTMKTHLSSIYEKCGLTSPDESGRGDKFARLLYLLFTLK